MEVVMNPGGWKLAWMLLAVPVLAQAPASPSKYQPCSLVSIADAEALTGMKVTESDESDAPYEKDEHHDHPDVLSICNRYFAKPLELQLSVTSRPVTPEGRERDKADDQAALDFARSRGGKIDKKDFGNIRCSTLTMSGELARANSTTCASEKGDLAFWLGVSASPKGLVPMEKVKAVAEKILSRMP
jgi:hypothetical protein